MNGRRAPGLLTLFLIVATGIGVTSGYFSWAAPRAKKEFDASMAAEPETPGGRVARWMDYGAPMVHSRLIQMRLSRQQPWGVTHTVVPAAGGAPEVWGIDLSELAPDVVTRESLDVVVRFPEPRALLRADLVGDNARHVPAFAEGTAVPDPRERLRFLAHWFLKDMKKALEGDIEGARLVVAIGAETPDEAAAAQERLEGREGSLGPR